MGNVAITRDLIRAIDAHRTQNEGSRGDARARARARAHLAELVKDCLVDEALRAIEARGGLDALASDIVSRTRDPYGCAEEIVALVLGHPAKTGVR
jgi:hypothetical protein